MIENQTARQVVTAAAVVGTIYLLWLLRDVLLLAVLAVFVAVALSAPVNLLQNRVKVPRALAIGIVYLALLGVLLLLGLLVIPPLLDEIGQFLRAVPRYVRNLNDSGLIEQWDQEYGLLSKLESQADKLPQIVSAAVSELETVTIGFGERLVEAIAILAVAFLLLLDAPRLLNFFYTQVAPDRADQMRRVAQQSAGAVGGYVAGVFAIGALAGVVSFFVMELLGIPFSVPLAVLMAFFALLPLVGSSIGALLIGIVAAFEGPEIVIIWIVFWVVYQQTETHVLGPLIYRRTVDMSPVIVILSVLAGATLLGVLGALLAIPAAATIQILVREWWRMRAANRPPSAVPAAPSTAET